MSLTVLLADVDRPFVPFTGVRTARGLVLEVGRVAEVVPFNPVLTKIKYHFDAFTIPIND